MAKKPEINPAYRRIVENNEPSRPVVKNCLKAFVVGGTVCVLGQLLEMMFMAAGMDMRHSVGAYLVVIIGVSALLTGLGIYDKLAQWAGAGLAVPISGFANSVTSACIEHRTEGYVLGVASNSFKLAGAVIVWGSFAAFIIALVKLLLRVL